MKLALIADDFSGAADAAAPFAHAGYCCRVVPAKNLAALKTPGTDILSVDLDTRQITDDAALVRKRTRAACRRLIEARPDLVFKKIDSALRGNLRVELDAVMASLRLSCAVICPAFPANHRTISSGRLHVAAQAGVSPNDGCCVRAMFQAQETPTKEVSLEELRAGMLPLHSWIERGVRMVFCDAVLDSDLDEVAREALRHPATVLPVGSAGLAAAVARAITPQAGAIERKIGALTGEELRALVVVGSRRPEARRQAAALTGRMEIIPVTLENELSGAAIAAREIAARFDAGDRVALLISKEEDVPGRPSSVLGAAAAHAARQLAADWPVVPVVAIGGETARAVFDALGAKSMRVMGELEPGAAWGEVEGEQGSWICGRVRLAVRSGSFGDDFALARYIGITGAGIEHGRNG
ncbi:MAG TPA: four-carbon acid sugar kinase family protein [Chthonomonadales bacterium]|nr:four-carbon acid sugar kinase family protein [Chthonomonadales bacterium]